MRKQHHAPERQKQQRQDGCSLEGMYLFSARDAETD